MKTQAHPATPVRSTSRPGNFRGFTLVELLTAMTVLLVMVLVMVQMTSQTNKIWRTSRARINAFQQARNAFERVTSNLSQATLNTYFDYYDANSQCRSDVLRATAKNHQGDANAYALAAAAFKPVSYDRASDLQFVSGPSEEGSVPLIKPANAGTRPTHALFFQCPFGYVADPNPPSDPSQKKFNYFKNLTRALNAVGYYVEFANASDKSTVLGKQRVPAFIANPPSSYRYRLMELNQPSQYLSIYAPQVAYANPGAWFSLAVASSATPTASTPIPTFPVAENVVALIVRPKVANPSPNAALPTEIAPAYYYDTKSYFTSPPASSFAKLSKNQLPSLVQVTLVAIDADSAVRLASTYGATPPPLVDASLFSDVTKYDDDVAALEASLLKQRLTYRTFVTDVSLPEAKWSEIR